MRHKEIVEHLDGYIVDLHKWIEDSARLIEIYKERIAEINDRIKELEEVIADTTKLLETNQ